MLLPERSVKCWGCVRRRLHRLQVPRPTLPLPLRNLSAVELGAGRPALQALLQPTAQSYLTSQRQLPTAQSHFTSQTHSPKTQAKFSSVTSLS